MTIDHLDDDAPIFDLAAKRLSEIPERLWFLHKVTVRVIRGPGETPTTAFRLSVPDIGHFEIGYRIEKGKYIPIPGMYTNIAGREYLTPYAPPAPRERKPKRAPKFSVDVFWKEYVCVQGMNPFYRADGKFAFFDTLDDCSRFVENVESHKQVDYAAISEIGSDRRAVYQSKTWSEFK